MSKLTTFAKTAGTDIVVDEKAAANAIAQAAQEAQTGDASGVTYLNFSGKLGKYSLGRDKEDVDPGEVYMMETQSLFRGWQCWKSSKPVDKVTWSVFRPQDATEADELPDHSPYKQNIGEGWKQMLGFGAVSLDAEDLQVQFSTDSVSGRNAVSEVMQEISQRLAGGEPHIPVFSFDREQFTAQEQTNWKPKFTIHAWVTREQGMAHIQGVITKDALLQGKPLTAAQKKKLAA